LGSFETPFFLKKGEQPDLIKLNVVVKGGGKVWVKDVELIKAPLPTGRGNEGRWGVKSLNRYISICLFEIAERGLPSLR